MAAATCAVLLSYSPPLDCRRADLGERPLMFRVVGYLPGTGIQTTITHGLRAGVAQASGEETAGNANAGVPGANAMGIRAAA